MTKRATHKPITNSPKVAVEEAEPEVELPELEESVQVESDPNSDYLTMDEDGSISHLQNSPQLADPAGKKSKLHNEYHLKIKPVGILKVLGIVVLLVAVFFLGRFSAGGFPIDFTNSGATAAVVAVAPEEPTEIVATEDTEIIKDDPVAKVDDNTEETADTELEANNEEVTADSADNETSDNETEEVEEEITNFVNTYEKVAISLNDVKVEWLGTWGRIQQIEYTINNRESGAVKAHHFGMMVEGYGDFEKQIPIPISSEIVKSEGKVKGWVNVPKGFSYSKVSAGRLDSVHITLLLYDNNDKVMGTFHKDFDLDKSNS